MKPVRILVIFAAFATFAAFFASFQVLAQESWLLKHFEEVTSRSSFPEIDLEIDKAVSLGDDESDRSIARLYSLYKRSESLNYNYGVAKGLLSIGNVYINNKKDPISGRRWLEKAMIPCEQAGFQKGKLMMKWNSSMGASFSLQGRSDSALLYYYKALAVMKIHQVKDDKYLARIYNNIGFTYYEGMKNVTTAWYYLKQAEELSLSDTGRYAELGRTYAIAAIIFIKTHELDSARAYLNKTSALSAFLDKTVKEVLPNIYGHLYFEEGKIEKSVQYFKHGLAAAEGNPQAQIVSLSGLGVSYYLLKRFPLSNYYLKEALRRSIEVNGNNDLTLYKNLAAVNDSLGNYKSAYSYVFASLTLQDSIHVAERESNINEIEVRYRTALKDKEVTAKELQLASAENKLHKKDLLIRSIASGALILFLVGVYVFQTLRLKLQRAQAREQEQKINQLRAIIEAEEKERSRIGRQLHDDVMVELSIVKMNLTALPFQYPEIKEVTAFAEVERQLQHASIKLRQAAHNLMPDTLLEEGLLSAIHYFCSSVEKTTGIRIVFEPEAPIPDLGLDTEINLYRITQELIQNVIKHASATEVLLTATLIDDVLKIAVKDNGTGFADVGSATEGMGLKSIRTRLQALQGKMTVTNVEPRGANVSIEAYVRSKETSKSQSSAVDCVRKRFGLRPGFA